MKRYHKVIELRFELKSIQLTIIAFVSAFVLSCGTSSGQRVNVELRSPILNMNREFECLSDEELHDYLERKYLLSDDDDDLLIGEPIKYDTCSVSVPSNDYISLELRDKSIIGYKLVVTFRNDSDVEILQNNAQEFVNVVSNVIFYHLRGRYDWPQIEEHELRAKIFSDLKNEFKFNGWFHIALLTPCNFRVR